MIVLCACQGILMGEFTLQAIIMLSHTSGVILFPDWAYHRWTAYSWSSTIPGEGGGTQVYTVYKCMTINGFSKCTLIRIYRFEGKTTLNRNLAFLPPLKLTLSSRRAYVRRHKKPSVLAWGVSATP